jgi:BCD family chlorophyll transporter-like MFS transporter
VDAPRRAAAATTVWLMMIAGFAITAGLAGRLLDPYSPARLVEVTAGVALAALIVAFLGVRGIEGPAHAGARPAGGDGAAPQGRPKASFRAALAEVWDEPVARRFTVFVFVSMLAYSAQDLILEPFAGSVYGYTPGESTSLSGVQHGGVLLGMLLVAIAGSTFGGRRIGSLRGWSVGGCLASALALLGLAAAGFIGPAWPLRPSVFFLGVANGAFAVAAIGSMMNLAGEGHQSREGVRMGLWGAAQAVAFGLGGLLGTGAVDVTRALSAHTGNAYSFVFAAESAVFVVSAWLALGLGGTEASNPAARLSPRVLAPSQLSGAEAYATGRR